MTTTDFPRWLRGQMDRREWNVTRLARELGINHGTVSQWLSGDRRPSPASLEMIADHLVVDYDDLLVIAGHRPRLPQDELDRLHARFDPYLLQMVGEDQHLETMEHMIAAFVQGVVRDRQRRASDRQNGPEAP